MSNQTDLFGTTTFSVKKEPKPLNALQRRVLDRLREGPASTNDLSYLTSHYRTVLAELSNMGWHIRTEACLDDLGLFLYTLMQERSE